MSNFFYHREELDMSIVVAGTCAVFGFIGAAINAVSLSMSDCVVCDPTNECIEPRNSTDKTLVVAAGCFIALVMGIVCLGYFIAKGARNVTENNRNDVYPSDTTDQQYQPIRSPFEGH